MKKKIKKGARKQPKAKKEHPDIESVLEKHVKTGVSSQPSAVRRRVRNLTGKYIFQKRTSMPLSKH